MQFFPGKMSILPYIPIFDCINFLRNQFPWWFLSIIFRLPVESESHVSYVSSMHFFMENISNEFNCFPRKPNNHIVFEWFTGNNWMPWDCFNGKKIMGDKLKGRWFMDSNFQRKGKVRLKQVVPWKLIPRKI